MTRNFDGQLEAHPPLAGLKAERPICLWNGLVASASVNCDCSMELGIMNVMREI